MSFENVRGAAERGRHDRTSKESFNLLPSQHHAELILLGLLGSSAFGEQALAAFEVALLAEQQS